jgi:hypothetical protein
MSNERRNDQTGASSGMTSRAAIGRFSGAVSSWFGSSTGLKTAGRFFRRQLWIWPIIGAIVFTAAHWIVTDTIEKAMLRQRANDLNAMVDASVTAVRTWMNEQKIDAQLVADDDPIRPWVAELLAIAKQDNSAKLEGAPKQGGNLERALVQAKAQDALRQRLNPSVELCGCVGYIIVAPGGVVIAADLDSPVGTKVSGFRKELFDEANGGRTLVSKPYLSTMLLKDKDGNLRANLPTMFAATPIRDEKGKPIAALGLRIRPEDNFTKILRVAHFGKSGETYAFDRQGLLLSESRFDEDLKQMGLLVDQPESQSVLSLEVRDPQVNMADGARPKLRRPEQPLTRLAAEAVQGKDGFDAAGYRNYRGVLSVGAWRWLTDYDMAIATEIDAAEAFQAIYVFRRAFWVILALLILGSAGILAATIYIGRQQQRLREAAIEAKRLGQYTLEEKLGAGGMGTVYKARHAMLRRDTAVKLLDVDKMSETAIARFEREVQLTCGLTHPNTVAIFDYGRTPEGIFFYAMEYLEGMNLESLVHRNGPLGEARAVFFLRQICGALGEAHARGLIHRDIKPANIFITNRGGLYDFVKVLDFGLVKSLESPETAGVTNPHGVTGTPLYISPEAVYNAEKVDARSDVYAVGAVAYFLLTGTALFDGESVVAICMAHVKRTPELPSARLGKPISRDLESLIMRCLAKSPDERPADANELHRILEECSVPGTWTAADAAKWWTDREASSRASAQDPGATAFYSPVPATVSEGATIAYQGDTRKP